MLPNSLAALSILLLTIVPGYVATSAWARSRTWTGHPSDLRLVLRCLTLSLVVQVIAAPATMALVYSFRTDPWSHPRRMMLWAVLVVLVIPLVGGVVAGRVGDWAGISGPNHQPLDSSGISRLVRQVVAKLIPNPVAPTGWDALFLQRPPHGAFVIVEYDDGHKVCGCFASQSFAITSPEAHAVFLQEEWQLDDGGAITRRVAGTGGVLISQTDDIRIVHIVLGDSESAETEETVDG